MQALKSLVVVLGVLIVVSLGLLAWGFYSKLSQNEGSVMTPTAAEPLAVDAPARGSATFGEVAVELPAGCAIEELRPDAGRLYVRTGPVGDCQRIIVLDPANGQRLGTFVFRP